ncbi:MAG: hypothetical protein P9M15_03920 [Candidatus Electryoneaceae bacterium]|nr:hypothetical protein [Candidatus Electryoneaceae bacterium]
MKTLIMLFTVLSFGFTLNARIIVVAPDIYENITIEEGFGGFSSLMYNADSSYVMFDMSSNKPIPTDLLEWFEDYSGDESDVYVLTVTEWHSQKLELGFNEEEED